MIIDALRTARSSTLHMLANLLGGLGDVKPADGHVKHSSRQAVTFHMTCTATNQPPVGHCRLPDMKPHESAWVGAASGPSSMLPVCSSWRPADQGLIRWNVTIHDLSVHSGPRRMIKSHLFQLEVCREEQEVVGGRLKGCPRDATASD